MRGRMIVIGASADGIEAISRVVSGLPANFAAPVFVVQHVGRQSLGYLPGILTRAGRLPAVHPQDGELIENGKIYVAPPNRHLLIRGQTIHLSDGPQENYCRPAVDVLFRSAARARGASVVGVVLTGYLSDGTAGLAAIKDRGGVAIVQDPAHAAVPSMPRSVLASLPVDDVLPIEQIANRLIELVADDPGVDREARLLELEDQIAGGEATPEEVGELLAAGVPSRRPCPLCPGPLFTLPEPRFRRYRCANGHAFTTMSLHRDADLRRPVRRRYDRRRRTKDARAGVDH